MRVAALQMCSGVSASTNLDAIETLTESAHVQGANYVLTPEVSVVFPKNRAQLAELVTADSVAAALVRCGAIAKRFGLYLHLGSLAVPDGKGLFFNRSVLFGPDGNQITQYDKIHLFDADPPGDRPYRESDTYRAGTEAVMADIGEAKLGLTICYDLRFAKLFHDLASAGAQILSVPAAFTVPTGQAHWEILLRARAIETASFVIAAAQGGHHENGRATYGHSMIIDPWGRILASQRDDVPGLIVADLDMGLVQDARARLPALANTRDFSLSVNHSQAN